VTANSCPCPTTTPAVASWPRAPQLLGLVKHLAFVEVYWTQRRFAGSDVTLRGDGFELEPTDTVESVRRAYAERDDAQTRSSARAGPRPALALAATA